MSVSVVMPLYNKEKSCIESIKSVLSQTYSNFELIIVDDGSTDSSAILVDNFIQSAENSAFVKLIRQENLGVSMARNRGVEESSFSFVGFLDADDLWHPQFLETMTLTKKRFPKSKWLACNCEEFKGVPPKHQIYDAEPRFTEKCYFETSMQDTTSQSAVYTGGFLVEKKLFNQVGGYPEGVMHSEDYDLYSRLAKFSDLVWTSRCLFFYRLDAENKASQSQSIRELPPFVIESKLLIKGHVNSKLNWENEFLTSLIINWIEHTIRLGLSRKGLKFELVKYSWITRNTKVFKKRLLFRVLPVSILNLISNHLANQLLAFSFKRIFGKLK